MTRVSGNSLIGTVMLVTGLLCATSAFGGNTGSRQSLEAIRGVVDAFVRQQAQGEGRIDDIRIDRLDPRLRLRACEGSLKPYLPRGQPRADRMTVGVRCSAPQPWKVFVPVQIVRHVTVVTAARPLPRGVRITRDALRMEERNVARLTGSYYVEPDQLIGLQSRRALRGGEVLSPRALAAPRLVEQGQKLVLEADSGPISVSMEGLALESGGKGDLIRVRNLSSNRIVQGRVVARDRVRITL